MFQLAQAGIDNKELNEAKIETEIVILHREVEYVKGRIRPEGQRTFE